MTTFAELVKQEPGTEKPSEKSRCPFCDGRNIKVVSGYTTLIGGGDGTVDGDPNHAQEESACRDCGQDFVRHTQSGKVWYTTKDGHVLRGWFWCFEHATYDCRACGGKVERHYRELDGVTPHTSGSLSYNFAGENPGPQQRTFWTCQSCGAEAETKLEHP